MRVSRRRALQNLTSFLLASLLFRCQESLPPIDPLFGKTMKYPIYLCPAGGKNYLYPDGELETAKGAIEVARS